MEIVFFKKLLSVISPLGSSPDDDEFLRQRKAIYSVVILLFDVPSSFLQALFYYLDNKRPAAYLHIGWAILEFTNFTFFWVRKTNFFPTVKRSLLLLLVMTILITISLEGIVSSGVYLIWVMVGIIAPSILLEKRTTLPVVCLILLILIIIAIVDPFVRPSVLILNNSLNASIVMNIIFVGMVIGVAISYFIRQRDDATELASSRTKELEEKNQELFNKNVELSQSREDLLLSTKRAEMIFSALSEALPGTVLDDKYSLEEKIGSGGFGTVYRAKHLMLNHDVAVKIFKPSFGNDPLKNLERFRIEGISACKIHHPNAVTVLDFGVSNNSIAYMVMELLQGHSLSDELHKNGNQSVARCIDILLPVCSALTEAHASDIVHRDIKPSNIFLHQAKEGEVVKVVDFGIAKLMSDTLNPGLESLTETGTFLGTPAYMSPERLSNKPYDGKADVYSVGVMMYEMLCGMQPFQSSKDNYWSIVLMHMTHTPISPSKVNPYISEKLESVMMATLEKEPQKRPTAKELSQMLEEFAGLEEPSVMVPTKDLSGKGSDTQRGIANQTIDLVGDVNSSLKPTVKDEL